MRGQPKKKVVWTNRHGSGGEIETAIKRAFHPPSQVKIDAPDLDGHEVGAMFMVSGASTGSNQYYDSLIPITVTRSPHRWLLPGYSAYNQTSFRGNIGIYTGLVRTEELKEWNATVVTSRLRHSVVIEGERFLLHDAFGLQFLGE